MLPRVSTLVLDTSDIITSSDKTSHLNSFTFRNIDFDLLLGEEWREYDLFNLVLVSIAFDVAEDIPTTISPEIRLTGPPFADPDIRVNFTKNEISISQIDLSSIDQIPMIVNYHGLNTWTLKRDDENLFNFNFRLVDPTTEKTASGTFSRQTYVFKIYKL